MITNIPWTTLKENNKAAGKFFWKRDTVRFFRSKNVGRPWVNTDTGAGVMVISSQYMEQDVTYAVRRSVLLAVKDAGIKIDVSWVDPLALAKTLARGQGEQVIIYTEGR